MGTKRSFRLDRRIIFLIIYIGIALPLARPFGFPLALDAKTIDAYNQVSALPENGKVMIVLSYAGSYFAEYEPSTVVLLRQLFNMPVKIYFTYFFYAEAGTLLHQNVLPQVDTRGKVYSVDWVDLGFVPGRESAMASLYDNIKGMISIDFFGDQIADYEVMEGVEEIKDFDLIINIGGGDEQLILRQWITPTKIPFVMAPGAMSVPSLMPYYGFEGGITGMLAGLRGGAEYEMISKIPGKGLSNMDAMSMAHLMVIFFVALGNVIAFYSRGREEQ